MSLQRCRQLQQNRQMGSPLRYSSYELDVEARDNIDGYPVNMPLDFGDGKDIDNSDLYANV